jgi:hypothetical protein
MVRKISYGLLLVGLLTIAGATMAQVYQGISKVPVQPQLTIDPALCFRAW